jgi:hypothetical protein
MGQVLREIFCDRGISLSSVDIKTRFLKLIFYDEKNGITGYNLQRNPLCIT